jgi:hypothetical protein
VHPLRHPRNAIVVGLAFIATAVVYFVWPVLVGGITLLVLLGVAMAVMAYVLVAGSPRD